MARPSILFINVDQMNPDAMSVLGNPHVHTPNLDRLARQGVTFRRSYCAMPQCVPARSTWMSGGMPIENGALTNAYKVTAPVPGLGKWLQDEGGYDTYYTGKWHISGLGQNQNFTVLRGSGRGELADPAVARSVEDLMAHRRPEEPFFLTVGLMNPHDCCYIARSSAGFSKNDFGEDIRDELPPLPDNFDYDRYRELKNQESGKGAGWSKLDWRYYIYSCYRMTEMVDAEVGRVLSALRSSPYAEDTLVIFSSDHGEGLGHHARTTKGFLYEESTGVPTIVSWPGRVETNVRDDSHLVNGVDLVSTVCDYAGLPEMPGTSDCARSWRPVLEGKAPDWRDYTVCENPLGDPGLAVIGQRYKAMFYREGETELYDLENDPGETDNLAGDADAAEALELCRSRLGDYLSRVDMADDFAATGRHDERQKRRLQKQGHRLKQWYRRTRKELEI